MTVKERTRAAVEHVLRVRHEGPVLRSMPESRRRRIKRRDGHRCVYCSSPGPLTVDHIVPICKGGTNDDVNLMTVCDPCNQHKGNRIIWKPRREVAERSWAA